MREYDNSYRDFLRKIWKRDKGRCGWPKCRCKGKEVHHVQRWSDAPYLRFDERNAILLCKKHHDELKNKEKIYASMLNSIIYEKYK